MVGERGGPHSRILVVLGVECRVRKREGSCVGSGVAALRRRERRGVWVVFGVRGSIGEETRCFALGVVWEDTLDFLVFGVSTIISDFQCDGSVFLSLSVESD